MPRTFRTANYATTLKLTVSLEEAVPPNHLARFIVDVVSQLDLGAIYGRYGERGGEAIAPEVLLGVLFFIMRDSGSVKLYWSLARGPGVGGLGALPRGLRFVLRAFSSRACILAWYSACSAA